MFEGPTMYTHRYIRKYIRYSLYCKITITYICMYVYPCIYLCLYISSFSNLFQSSGYLIYMNFDVRIVVLGQTLEISHDFAS